MATPWQLVPLLLRPAVATLLGLPAMAPAPSFGPQQQARDLYPTDAPGELGYLSLPATPSAGAEVARVEVLAPDVDREILTFALNLEYLETEYYGRGVGLVTTSTDMGPNAGDVQGGHEVPWQTPVLKAFADEIARNELAHVRLMRRLLGSKAPSRPTLDLSGTFTAAARDAGIVGPNEIFDPWQDELSFFLGGMMIEDVGITAYNGALGHLHARSLRTKIAGVATAEGHHMGFARTLLIASGGDAIEMAAQISAARRRLDGDTFDQGLELDGRVNFVPTDADAACFARTPRQVLDIVCLGRGKDRGGFYPDGMRGDVQPLMRL